MLRDYGRNLAGGNDLFPKLTENTGKWSIPEQVTTVKCMHKQHISNKTLTPLKIPSLHILSFPVTDFTTGLFSNLITFFQWGKFRRADPDT